MRIVLALAFLAAVLAAAPAAAQNPPTGIELSSPYDVTTRPIVSVRPLEAGLAISAFQGQNYLSTGTVPTPQGNNHPVLAPYGVFRTADIVGLDTFLHVAKNCYDTLTKDEVDEMRAWRRERREHLDLGAARGEAQARAGDAAAVRAEAAAIAALREGTDAPALGRGGSRLAEIAQLVLEGRAAMLAGDHEVAQRAYRRAMEAQLEADFGMDPPLFWYSVRRSLAAALLASGDAAGARNQLHASLRRWPNDPLALYALSLADRALGDARAAEGNRARARAGWAGDGTAVPLGRICTRTPPASSNRSRSASGYS